ncbi:1-acyl-sn-glycerol-3-phosphate acyltransferase [Archangium sp.]|uniref:1-acyl-sn-glycerol-3-phosphate acyltransferase n=1 Tax=Archangium sp. TaxID=1872627 RepID=UPI00286B88FD|nr:1-acyl-sn-glycerol-3-phosphate acyltransferase [Archangium sp.]
MATKGVLGNDPFQRGAAQRPAEPKKAEAAPAPEPKKAAPTKAEKKAPTSKQKRPATPKPAATKGPTTKPEKNTPPKHAASKHAAAKSATKSAAPKPAASRAKKAAAPRVEAEKTPAPQEKPAAPEAEVRVAPEAVIAATLEAAGERQRELSAEEEELLEEVAGEAVAAAEALRELEETLGEPLPTGAVEVPGFEGGVTARVAETVVVEVLDRSQDEHAPSSEAEAVEEARIEVEVEAALAPALPVSSHREVFFTSESPGAESPRLGARFSGLLSLAKDLAFQALASERMGKTMRSAQGLLNAALTGMGVGGGMAIDEYGKDSTLTGVMQPVVDFLYERYWRVSVQGASHVPTGPVLLVANHSGALPFDGPVLQQALSRERPDLQEARWLAEDQVFHAPMLGTLMNRLGAVRACPENALRLLDELRPIIVFPEGIQGLSKPFAQRYQLKRFGRGGFVKLALRTGAPIVPVAIVGAEETAPLFGKIPASFLGLSYLPLTPPPLPARWTIRFGDPISVGDLPPEAAEDMSQVQRLTERTRESIQGMLQALLKERRSVFAG